MQSLAWTLYLFWFCLTSWAFWEGTNSVMATALGPISPSMFFALLAWLISIKNEWSTVCYMIGSFLIAVGFFGLNVEANPPNTETITYRVGAVAADGWVSSSTGSGTGSGHGGVHKWLKRSEVIPIRPFTLQNWYSAFDSQRMKRGVIPLYFGASLVLASALGTVWARGKRLELPEQLRS